MQYLDLFRRQSQLGRLQNQMNRIFNDLESSFWGDFEPMSFGETMFAPLCNVEDADTHFIVSFDLPGVKKEDIKVDVQNGILRVSGERKEERKFGKKKNGRRESVYGAFERTFTLPSTIKSEEIEANFTDGVLTLTIPKAEEAKTRHIEIGDKTQPRKAMTDKVA